ncbi:MAG: radical SAM protein, partial [Planctomycetes bacterium]|nr:radical SAM protein [Planctomycetota bacterium]
VLARARRAGLGLPVVWNTNAYETPEALALLEGVVDIWLPDMKYGGDDEARRLSRAPGYVETAERAIRIMYDQVGDLEIGADGIARRGLIVRHLVLPGDLARTEACLAFLASISKRLRVSLMGQYSPRHRAAEHPPFDRPLSVEEYERSIEIAISLGLDDAWIQGSASREAGLPDFEKDDPFSW